MGGPVVEKYAGVRRAPLQGCRATRLHERDAWAEGSGGVKLGAGDTVASGLTLSLGD